MGVISFYGNYVLWELCSVGAMFCGSYVMWELCSVGAMLCWSYVLYELYSVGVICFVGVIFWNYVLSELYSVGVMFCEIYFPWGLYSVPHRKCIFSYVNICKHIARS